MRKQFPTMLTRNFLQIVLGVFVGLTAAAQSPSQRIFFVSSDPAQPIQYNKMREIDGKCKVLVKDWYQPEQKYAVKTHGFQTYLALQQSAFIGDAFGQMDTLRSPMGGSVASVAYDKKTNRLFYFPMYASELRYMDLSQPEPHFTYLDNQSLNLLKHRTDVANQISRMTIGADGFGYALTNDGEHLIRFSTEGQPTITDLGVITDKPGNGIFVRSSCTSWGGDMVADAEGRLVLITQSNYVFRINIASRVAEYLGQIGGLPGGFTTNGAAVDENGELILSCGSSRTQNMTQHLFRVKELGNLTAEAVDDSKIPAVGNISDMASSNLLNQRNNTPPPVIAFQQEKKKDILPEPVYTVFPNPVSRGKFTVRTQNIADKGVYSLLLVDMNGRIVLEGKMNLGEKTSNHSFNIPSYEAKGTYALLVVDYFKRTVFSTQLIVE
jgi:hypothetical protein